MTKKPYPQEEPTHFKPFLRIVGKQMRGEIDTPKTPLPTDDLAFRIARIVGQQHFEHRQKDQQS